VGLVSDPHKIQKLVVEGLFGRLKHPIEFGLPVTILTGPNGCGKTHVLRILKGVLSLDFRILIELPYVRLLLTFSDGRSIEILREVESDGTKLIVKVSEPGTKSKPFEINSNDVSFGEIDELPPWIIRFDQDRWFDERTGRYMSLRDLQRRFRFSGGAAMGERQRQVIIERYPILESIVERYPPTLIDTKRLDTPASAFARDDTYSSGAPAPVRFKSGRMGRYVGEIRSQVSEARRNSLLRSQEADERFPYKLLERSQTVVSHKNLVSTYDRLSKLSADLSENGLAGKVISVKIPSKANDTQKSVLDLFLHDWESKLEPLLPIHRKLTALKRIVNNKFVDKSIGFDAQGDIIINAGDGSDLRVGQLSSGEQHLLALFTLLLFSAAPGSTVLIDEPEISLHAAWKHAFIEDIEEVAGISDLTVVMATHSTAIINGRWELVEELKMTSKDG
jgi:ABC-type transport system involved in cytochrome c biogenesis ATPase subunit